MTKRAIILAVLLVGCKSQVPPLPPTPPGLAGARFAIVQQTNKIVYEWYWQGQTGHVYQIWNTTNFHNWSVAKAWSQPSTNRFSFLFTNSLALSRCITSTRLGRAKNDRPPMGNTVNVGD
jgi:hypothetical protein